MDKVFEGSCLCGKVKYKGYEEPVICGICQCVDCRKSSGSGHCAHMGLPEDKFQVSGEVSTYERPADSGNIVTRCFCENCGSPAYSTNSGMPGMVFPRASILDTPNVFKPNIIVYTKSAVEWDTVPQKVPSVSGMPELPF